MKTAITFEIDTNTLANYDDDYLAKLWYIAQANPVPIENKNAGVLAEAIGREIIKRWVRDVPPPLWDHQGVHHIQCVLMDSLTNQEAA